MVWRIETVNLKNGKSEIADWRKKLEREER